MRRYVVRRLLQAALVLVGVTVITFAMMVLAPGDPVTLLVSPEQLGTADVAVLRAQLGLDQSLPVQYADNDERPGHRPAPLVPGAAAGV